MHVRALVATPNGEQVIRAEAQGPSEHGIALSEQVIQQLQGQGAEEILAQCKQGE
jgi:hydroxymethylbilane synthase